MLYVCIIDSFLSDFDMKCFSCLFFINVNYVFLQVTVHEVIDLVENEDVAAKDSAKDGEKRRRQQLEENKREELLAEMGVNMLSDNSNSCDTLQHQPSRSQQKVSRTRKREALVFCGMIGSLAGP